jgi:multidrug efflux pump subunit AcrA (membrane-fusion protein)
MVAPTVDPQTRNGLVYVDLPTPGPARAGMFARGEFDVGSSTALTLPQSAVLLRDGFSYVYLVDAESKARQTKVGVGRRIGDRIEVTRGSRPVSARWSRRAAASSPTATRSGSSTRRPHRHRPPPHPRRRRRTAPPHAEARRC